MLSDDDLAKIAHQARQKGRFAPTWDELTVKWPWEQEAYRRIARAVRAALEDDDADQAFAVLDRLWARMPNGELSVDQSRALKDYIAIWEWVEAGEICTAMGDGPTPAAALLALGARLEGDE